MIAQPFFKFIHHTHRNYRFFAMFYSLRNISLRFLAVFKNIFLFKLPFRQTKCTEKSVCQNKQRLTFALVMAAERNLIFSMLSLSGQFRSSQVIHHVVKRFLSMIPLLNFYTIMILYYKLHKNRCFYRMVAFFSLICYSKHRSVAKQEVML